MSARLLEGRPVADAIWRDVEQRGAAFQLRFGRNPCLGLVSAAEHASAAAYGRQIERQFTRHHLTVLPRGVTSAELIPTLRALGQADEVDGILLLTPLPRGVDAVAAAQAIDPAKDVDGQHPASLGRLAQRRGVFAPATARGGLQLLRHYAIPVAGAYAVVVGRSPVVGLPLALLLIDADATVTVCHTRTVDLELVTRAADILCVAAGRPSFVGPRHVKPGATVLDFGTHAGADGVLLGDVQTDAVRETAGAITPVPGGTGPITVSVLAQQTLLAAELRLQ